MMDGLAKEPEISREYLASMIESGHKGIKVKRLGLIVNVAHLYLVASPDGVVNDPSYN